MKKSKKLIQAEEEVRLDDYIREEGGYQLKRLNDKTYRVNPCPFCGHKDHFTIYTDENKYYTFAECANVNNSGSLTEYLIETENITEEQKVYTLAGYTFKKEEKEMEKDVSKYGANAVKSMGEDLNQKVFISACNILKKGGIEIDDDITKYSEDEIDSIIKSANRELKNQVKQLKSDSIKFIERNLESQTSDNKETVYKYLQERGFKNYEELTEKFHLFVSNDVYQDYRKKTEKTDRLVIPIFEDKEAKGYVARVILDFKLEDVEMKAVNSEGLQIPLNIDYIKFEPNENKRIFVCEGWADAFSFEDIGEKAIALNSVVNVNKFLKYLSEYEETAKKYTYILSFDNDKAGRNATLKLKKSLDELNIKNVQINIPSEYKDINEWYKKDKDIIQKGLKIYEPQNALYYLENQYAADADLLSQCKQKKLGFQKLDSYLNGILPSLYILGAVSSMGKTTFYHQLADQLAEQGEQVLYFSFEQSKLELIAKSISRITYKNKTINDPAEVSLSIMQNSKGSTLRDKAIEEYKKFAQNIYIIEGNFDMTVNKIRNYIENFINIKGIVPIVFIDYLQIIKPENDRWSEKQQVDYNVSELRRICRDDCVPIFLLSSFNRGSYFTKASFGSFKESGRDRIWG